MTRIALLYPAGRLAADLVITRDAKYLTNIVTCQHCGGAIDLSDAAMHLVAFLEWHRECVARYCEHCGGMVVINLEPSGELPPLYGPAL